MRYSTLKIRKKYFFSTLSSKFCCIVQSLGPFDRYSMPIHHQLRVINSKIQEGRTLKKRIFEKKVVSYFFISYCHELMQTLEQYETTLEQFESTLKRSFNTERRGGIQTIQKKLRSLPPFLSQLN